MGRDVREGRTDGEVMTEVGPDSEDLVAGFVGFLCVSGVGDLESIAEVRVEVNSGDR